AAGRAWAGSCGLPVGIERRLDAALRGRPAPVARREREGPRGEAEVVVVPRPVEGAEILEVQAEEPPAERLPALRAQGPREGGRYDERPALVRRRDAGDRHRIAER